MQKKLLASVLVAPLAFNAFANISINGNLAENGTNWSQTGISGTNPFQGGGILCPIGSGILQMDLGELNPGNYVLKFTDAKNIRATVSNGVDTWTPEHENDDLEFEVTATSKYTLTITGAKADQTFSLDKIAFEIVFNLDEVQATLGAALDKVVVDQVNEDDESSEAKALREVGEKLAAEKTRIEGVINGLTETTDDYDKYELWKDENTIQKDINKLADDVKAHNDKVKAENDKYQLGVKNQSVLNGLLATIDDPTTGLDALLNAQIKKYGEGSKLDADAKAYVSKTNNPTALSIRAEIDLFRKAIKDAEADKYSPDFKAPEDKYESIKTRIENLSLQIDNSIDDWKAYNTLMNLQSELTATTSSALEVLTGDKYKGVAGMDKSFNAYVAKQEADIRGIYSEALDKVVTKRLENPTAAGSLAGVSDNFDEDKGILTEATDRIKGISTAADKAQETYWNNVEIVNGEVKKLADPEVVPALPLGLPETETAKYDALKKAAEDAVNSLKTQVNDQYDATLDITTATSAFTAVSDFVKDWKPVIGLINDLNDLKAHIEKLQADSKVPTDEFDLLGKFKGTIESLDAAIKAVYEGKEPSQFDPQKIADVKTAIDERKGFADELMKAYVDASTSVGKFQTMVDGLNKDIEDKLIVADNSKPAAFKETDTYKNLSKKLKEVTDALNKVRTSESQESYETAVALQGMVDGYPELVAAAVHEFEKTYTGNNKTTVSNALEELRKYAYSDAYDPAKEEYWGQNKLDFSGLQTELDGIVAKIIAADALADDASDLVKTYSDIDTELNALYGKIAGQKKEVKALKDNQAAYDELFGIVPDTDVIKALWDYNIEKSDVPAEDYYKGVIGQAATETDAATGLYKERLELLADLLTALEEKTAFTGKQALSDKITAFSNKIKQTYSDIDANNANYSAQNVESDRIRVYINDLIDEINTKAEEAAAFNGSILQEAVDGWVNTLTALRDTDLNNEDLVANGYYGKGQSAEKNDEVMKEYKRIEDLAKAVETEFNDQFFDKVKATNDQTVADANWEASISYTENIYRQAIETYNSFFQLNNPYYSQYILTVVQTHRDIYQFSKQITDLKAEVAKTVAKYNEDGDVFTADEFKEFALDKANALILAMVGDENDNEGKVTVMMKQCNEAAKQYYNGQNYTFEAKGNDGETIYPTAYFAEAATSYEEAQKAIEGAEKVLDEAGVGNLANRAIALSAAYRHLKTAVDTYTANKDAWLLALNFMNGVANDLDAVAGSIDLDAAAVAQWKNNYESATEMLDDIKANLEKCTSDGDEAREQLAAYIDQAAELNVQATDIENLSSKTSKLHVIVDAAESLYAEKKAQYDNDQANKQLAAEFQARLDKLMSDYYALVQYVGSITANVSLNNINDAIESVKDELEADKASLVANKKNIERLFDIAEGAISAAYSEAQSNEISALYDLLAKTKVAFNNAKVLSTTLTADELAAIDTRITEIEKGKNNGEGILVDGIYNLNGLKDIIEERPAFLALAQSIESELSGIYVKLMSSYETTDGVVGGDPVPGIISALTEKYVALESQIVDAQEAFTHYFESVQNKYPEGYNNLLESLEAVKELWEADGNKVVLNGDNYKNDMEAIARAFNDRKGEIEAAEAAAKAKYEAMQANDAAYDRLENELKGYEERLEALAEVVNGYDLLTTYKQNLDNLTDEIDNARVWLADEHARCRLTVDSSFGYPYNNISNEIYWLSFYVERTHINNVRSATWGIINGAFSIFYNNTVVPEIADEQLPLLNGLSQEMSKIYNDFRVLITQFYNSEITIDEFVDGCHKLDERYQEICAKADEIQKVAHENIFFRGDVNDAPDGVVNATDLQMIIGWILDGTTYQQLYEASPVQAAAADLTGDKSINIADATDEVELILNEDNGIDVRKVAPRMARNGVRTGNNTFSLAMLSSENGERDYALTLNNGDTFIAGQFDINLPIGMSIQDVQLDARAANHQVMFSDNGNGNYRIVVISMTNEAIQGNDGVLLHIITNGIGTPTLSNGIFADEQHVPVQVKVPETTMIEAIQNGAVNVKERIYDAAGRTLRAVQHGINIIRKSDGTTTKEFHK